MIRKLRIWIRKRKDRKRIAYQVQYIDIDLHSRISKTFNKKREAMEYLCKIQNVYLEKEQLGYNDLSIREYIEQQKDIDDDIYWLPKELKQIAGIRRYDGAIIARPTVYFLYYKRELI